MIPLDKTMVANGRHRKAWCTTGEASATYARAATCFVSTNC